MRLDPLRVCFVTGVVALTGLGIVYTWSRPARAPAAERSTHEHGHGMLMAYGVSPPEPGGTLPIGVEHGLAHRLRQYTEVSKATPAQRAAAERLARELYASARHWAVGGPITRWHDHLVCVRGRARGLAPRPNGSCTAGARLGIGSEMMHVWFTRDLRNAYAVHAPWPELCAARLLPSATCASGQRPVGM